jgi:hypothetical protein
LRRAKCAQSYEDFFRAFGAFEASADFRPPPPCEGGYTAPLALQVQFLFLDAVGGCRRGDTPHQDHLEADLRCPKENLGWLAALSPHRLLRGVWWGFVDPAHRTPKSLQSHAFAESP